MNDVLPREWMRGPQWASPATRREWEPVLRAAAAAWEQLEIESVSAGARLSALLFLTPAELVKAFRDVAGRGLELTPLAWDGQSLRVALHVAELRAAWLEAWACGDDQAIGELLGFPSCCRDHFAATWARGVSDTVLPMREADGPLEANVMHRHVGVRLVPHLPCSAACEPSVDLGRRLTVVGNQAGIDVAAIRRVLSLPVEYSALHGVAITQTPHWRVMSGTDWTPDERRAQRAEALCRERTCQSEECGAPADPPHHHDLAVAPIEPSVAELAGLPAPAVEVRGGRIVVADEPWRDNGFSTREAMERAHEVVAAVVGKAPGRVLDLGCGDGTLLARLTPVGDGIERDPDVVARGRARHSSLGLHLLHGTIERDFFDGSMFEPFDVALVMPGRLVEMRPEDAARVRAGLYRQHRVVGYAYGDWLSRYGGLPALASAVGLRVVGPVKAGPGVEAAEVTLA